MNHVCLNGKFFPADKPVLMADNRGYRYGDGLFETMKLFREHIMLEKFHFDRLFSGLEILKFKIPSSFTRKKLRQHIFSLCKKNQCSDLSRIRLSVFRGNGGLYDSNDDLQYLIECWPVDEQVNQLIKKGWIIDIYPGAEKNCDVYSNLKSANYLPYTMAARYAKENKLNDCLVCNTKGYIADATIANIFLIKNNLIITPALAEGCVNGVMRKYLINKLQRSEFEMREGVVTGNDLETFDEVFLTNAINGIRWVKQFRDKTYTNNKTVKIFKEFILPLYS